MTQQSHAPEILLVGALAIGWIVFGGKSKGSSSTTTEVRTSAPSKTPTAYSSELVECSFEIRYNGKTVSTCEYPGDIPGALSTLTAPHDDPGFDLISTGPDGNLEIPLMIDHTLSQLRDNAHTVG